MSARLTLACHVRDGKFVEPCSPLSDVLGRSLQHERWHNIDGTPSRSFVTVRAGLKGQKPVALNFCPFCGGRIDAPFASKTDEVAEA